MRKLLTIPLLGISLLTLNSCTMSSSDALKIYNCGEYIDEELLDLFMEENDCNINYITFDSNEAAITKMNTESYDLVIPSDYAIEQLMLSDMIKPIDWSKIEGFTKEDFADPLLTITDMLKNQENGYDLLEYAVPYFFGNVGICYDANIVDEEDLEAGWAILQNTKYKNKVAYYDSSRDGFMVAYKELGYSMNTTSIEETEEAYQWIKDIRKTTNCAFKTDELLSEMPDGKYAISLMYSGDAIYSIMEEKDSVDLQFYVPDTGTNVFIDGMVIPTTAKHDDLAYKFISFMLQHENAKANSIYVGYTSPVKSVYEELVLEDEEFYEYRDYYKVDISPKDEIYRYNSDMKIIQNDYWVKLKLS